MYCSWQPVNFHDDNAEMTVVEPFFNTLSFVCKSKDSIFAWIFFRCLIETNDDWWFSKEKKNVKRPVIPRIHLSFRVLDFHQIIYWSWLGVSWTHRQKLISIWHRIDRFIMACSVLESEITSGYFLWWPKNIYRYRHVSIEWVHGDVAK